MARGAPRSPWLLAFLTVTWLFLEVEATAQGALKLDNYTFSKVTSLPGWSFLVKFDQSYAYGEKEDEFKLLCKHAHQVPHFMMAEVPVQEFGDKENDDLRDQFKLTKEDFPTYFLINEANPSGQRYTGAVKADLLVRWLRRHQIAIPSLGTIEELDILAQKFMQDPKDAGLVAEAKKFAEENSDKKAAVYVKIMQKIQEKGLRGSRAGTREEDFGRLRGGGEEGPASFAVTNLQPMILKKMT